MPDLSAQSTRLGFKQLTTDDGLSTSIVSCIKQDSRGFMWIGTADGLNRYDGSRFVVYRYNPDDISTIPDNVVQTVYEDRGENLFIGTENGLCLYERDKDRFYNFMADKSSPLYGLDCGIQYVAEDSVSNLWLATTVGLIYFDRHNNTIKRYTHNQNDSSSLSYDNVECVLLDKFQRLWVTTRRGLNLFDPVKERFLHFYGRSGTKSDLSEVVFVEMKSDHNGNIWIASNDGLFYFDINKEPETSALIHYQHDIKDKSGLSLDQVTTIFEDISNKIWIGTENGGLNLFEPETGTFRHFLKDDYDAYSLNNESIEAIYQDRSGNLWIGTYTGGLNIAVNNLNSIVKFQNLPGAPLSLSHNTVTSFLEDHLGNILVGTDGGGLNIFDPLTNHFRRYNTSNSKLPSNSVLCLTEDSLGRIWLGTWAGGLVQADLRNESFRNISVDNSNLHDNNIFEVAEGFNNDLWLGTFEHGLVHYQIKENKFTDYNTINSGIGDNMVVKILKLPGKRLLIATSDALQIFSIRTEKFTTFSYNKENRNSLSYHRVTDALIENDTCIWIATPNGLNRFNPVSGTFVRYYVEDGLPNNFVTGLILDNEGKLWITTNNGVCRFDRISGRFKIFTRADGFQSNEFSERSAMRTRKGELFLGGTRGFNIIHPEKIVENTTIPEVVLTDLKIFNKSVRPGEDNSPLKQNITETKSLVLQHNQSVLTFSFSVLDFSAPEKNMYAYKMENFDRDWNYSGNKGEATYTNLNPGSYLFRVIGSNNDGLWNNTGSTLLITILPPWWNTLLFRILVIVFFLIVLYMIYLYRVKSLERQKILLEKTVEMKTAELEALNVSKDKFFSIIAHDLKNPFSTIVGLSEVLDEDESLQHSGRVKQIVHMIHSSSVQTFRLLENLLEWAGTQRGTIPFKPVCLNLNELVREEVHLLRDMASGKGIEILNLLPENIYICGDRNMIKTVIRNLVSNAIKYTRRNGRVQLSAEKKEDKIEFSVKDTGIGIKESVMSKLFSIDANLSTRGTEDEKGTGLGLLLCREFITKHNGRIWAESELGKGSTFKFILPVNQPD